ncbi:hypothetical protein ACFCV8_26820 [Streptomyces sp. NPDC056347]|uniref:hypothetical protein n=1 Tax=Streptomyces sp. NPDC056347 TaxID=3345790 RepID=UPI0035D8E257
MKRLLHAAGIAIAATALCLTTATSASAANGTLGVSGNTFKNPPAGCYTGKFIPLFVNNQTNVTVTVYGSSDCSGYAEGTVAPGKDGVFEFGNSVRVPR